MWCGFAVINALARIIATESCRITLLVDFHGFVPRMESFLFLSFRLFKWSAFLLLRERVVRSSTNDSSMSFSCWSARHMLAAMVGMWW